jgi:hypothetical protein
MLYNKAWDKKIEIKADPLAMESLVAWLEQRNPWERYDYGDTRRCPLACYFTAMGYGEVVLDHFEVTYAIDGKVCSTRLPNNFDDVARGNGIARYFSFFGHGDWTYGKMLERAKACL